MISAVDKGDSGKLSFENFETAIMRKIMSQDSDGDIMKSFRLFDMDDAGKLKIGPCLSRMILRGRRPTRDVQCHRC